MPDGLILQQKKDFAFQGRNKRPPLDNTNALLSFVYTLLTNSITSALECVGLDPYVGYLHTDRPGRASLSLDLIEELRAVLADRFVLSLINKKIINEKIPETVKKNAPADYYELYTDFKSEYEKFRDFILYDSLIGKNIVALGGGFSSGKSSFLNALNGEAALPEDVDPSTSVPTYIVNGKKYKVLGINIFDTKVEIETREIKKIAHGFGEIYDDDDEIVDIGEDVTLGHVLESIFLSIAGN